MSDYERRKKIDFLVQQEFPFSTIIKGLHKLIEVSGKEVDKDESYIKIEKYENELKSKSDEELEEIHYTTKRRLEVRHRNNFIFYRVEEPNYKYWGKLDYWNIEESIALTFNKNPRELTFAAIASAEKEYSDNYDYRRYTELKEILLRAVSIGRLKNSNTPIEFLDWVESNKIDFPEELKKQILETVENNIDYKEQYKSLKIETDKKIASLNQKIRELKKRNESLESKKTPKANTHGISSLEVVTLYKLIHGMAIKGYSHKFDINKTSTTVDISEDTGLDSKTVRKWLNKAHQEITKNSKKSQ